MGTHILTTYLPSGIGRRDGLANGARRFWIYCRRLRDNGRAERSALFNARDRPGSYGATSIRNGTQYFGRIDQGFKNDRIYVSIFRTLLLTGAPSPMPQFSALNNTWQVAGQASWTHTFSPNTLNEFTAGLSRVEGVLGSGAKDYTVPSIIGERHQRGFGIRPTVWVSRREISFSTTITGATCSRT